MPGGVVAARPTSRAVGATSPAPIRHRGDDAAPSLDTTITIGAEPEQRELAERAEAL